MSAEQARTALRVALELVDHGYALTPVTLTRAPGGGKVARFHERWQRDPAAVSTDPAVVRDWHAQHGCSFAVVCEPSGVEGVDLDVKPDGDRVAWWSAQGLPVSRLRVRTLSGGEHHLYRAGQGRGLPTTSKGGGLSGLDARGVGGLFYAPGAFVVGEPGHYELTDPLVKPSDLDPTPDDVLELFDAHPAGRPAGTGQCPRRGTRGVVGHWHGFTDGAARDRLDEQVRGRMADAVHGVDVNTRLNDAAGEAGRFVPALWSRGEAFDYVAAALLAGPGKVNGWSTLDRNDVATINSGLNYGMTMPHCRADDDQGDGAAEPAGPDPLAREIERQRLLRDAREALAAERAEPLRKLSAAEFLASPSPSYLIPQMLPADGLSTVFGPEGTAKSFLALDIALHIATGRPWRGVPVTRAVVHYVMAEGQGVNKLRTLAWLAHHRVDASELDGWFVSYPHPILLTATGVGPYLRDVAEDRPALVILDTKNLMFEGKESAGEDGGALARVLHTIRRAAGGTCVVLIDHTGLNDTTRVRGGNAQRAAMDTEVRIMRGEGGVSTATITRDKSGFDEGDPPSWSYRLAPVPSVPAPPKMMTPAVVVDAVRPATRATPLIDSCWDIPTRALPALVRDVDATAGQRNAAQDVFRALVEARDTHGMSKAAITALLGSCPRRHGRTTVFGAVAALTDAGVLVPVGDKWVLDERFERWEPDADKTR